MWHRRPHSTFPFFLPCFCCFPPLFLIFSYKSPRAPHISHSTCFPGSFQIWGSEDSLGGSGRALSPYPSPYLETSDEKDFGRKLIIVAFLCGSKWWLEGVWIPYQIFIRAKEHEGTRRGAQLIPGQVSPGRQAPPLRGADKHRTRRVCLHLLRAMSEDSAPHNERSPPSWN